MALETGTYISDLVATNPVVGDDVSAGDDHFRLIKSTILASFPGVTGAVTATHTELNVLDGIPATLTATEIGYLDGVTSSIQDQIDALDSGVAGEWILLNSTTATVSPATAAIDFINGTGGVVIDSTYDEYQIVFVNVQPQTDGAELQIQVSTDAGSNWVDPSGGVYATATGTTMTVAQSTTGIFLTEDQGNVAVTEKACGNVLFYKPSSSANMFIESRISYGGTGGGVVIRTTSSRGPAADTDAIRILYSTGNIQSGTVNLYARRKS